MSRCLRGCVAADEEHVSKGERLVAHVIEFEWKHTRGAMWRESSSHLNVRHIGLRVICAELRRSALRTREQVSMQGVVPRQHDLHLVS